MSRIFSVALGILAAIGGFVDIGDIVFNVAAGAAFGYQLLWAVVIGVGGYSSGPVVLLSALRGIPTLLMEQNAMPGITNRLLAPVVDAAAVTYQESVRFFGTKAIVSGNPVRPEFFGEEGEHGIQHSPPGAARVLVFGGSQGEHAINMAMVEAAPRLAAAASRVAITHQTGERDLEMVRDGYRRAGLEVRVEPFLFAMDREMKAADVIVCRAGATTLAELAACGRASILVPLPTATDDHQRKNAQVLERGGGAVVEIHAGAAPYHETPCVTTRPRCDGPEPRFGPE